MSCLEFDELDLIDKYKPKKDPNRILIKSREHLNKKDKKVVFGKKEQKEKKFFKFLLEEKEIKKCDWQIYRYKNSRFDGCIKTTNKTIHIEYVKSLSIYELNKTLFYALDVKKFKFLNIAQGDELWLVGEKLKSEDEYLINHMYHVQALFEKKGLIKKNVKLPLRVFQWKEKNKKLLECKIAPER